MCFFKLPHPNYVPKEYKFVLEIKLGKITRPAITICQKLAIKELLDERQAMT